MKHVIKKLLKENTSFDNDWETAETTVRHFRQNEIMNFLPNRKHLIQAIASPFEVYFDIIVPFFKALESIRDVLIANGNKEKLTLLECIKTKLVPGTTARPTL